MAIWHQAHTMPIRALHGVVTNPGHMHVYTWRQAQSDFLRLSWNETRVRHRRNYKIIRLEGKNKVVVGSHERFMHICLGDWALHARQCMAVYPVMHASLVPYS